MAVWGGDGRGGGGAEYQGRDEAEAGDTDEQPLPSSNLKAQHKVLC